MFSRKSFCIALTSDRSAEIVWLRLTYENESSKAFCLRYAE